jgi:DNA-binding PadR family transcriptional regulator
MSQPARKPLSLPVLHIMLALAEGARHGYAIKQDVEARTNGAIRLGPSTLYEAIQRLEDTGLIKAVDDEDEPVNGQEAQRRYYALTPLGWRTLQDEVRQLDTIVSAARANPRLRKGLA